MRVVVDRQNPLVVEAFSEFGEVQPLLARAITTDAVKEAEMVIVRSETRVDAELLDGSKVRFVGTATIGTDHVDLGYLKSRNIGFASAPGSNANSVAEYIIAALLTLSGKKQMALAGKTLGVVGVGNVGSRVVHYGRSLGMNVMQNDPPRERASGDSQFRPLPELMDADFITLHVPLERSGSDPTFHLFDSAVIGRMKRGSVLLNTSRGAVVDGGALNRALAEGRLGGAVLDVWEGEPSIDFDLVKRTDIATPHIAGYSYDGKLNAVRMLYSAACTHFGRRESWTPGALIPRPIVEEIGLSPATGVLEMNLGKVVAKCYNILADDALLRRVASNSVQDRGSAFSRLRAEYGVRREFFNTTVTIPASNAGLTEALRAIGFKVSVMSN